MPQSTAFLLRFLTAAAVFFALWSFGGVGDAYGRAVITLANPLMWIVSGFSVSRIMSVVRGLDVYVRKGPEEVLIPLQPRELFSGIIPFLSLMTASRGLTIAQRARGVGIGVAVMVLFHIGLLLLAPFLATAHVRWVNTIIDIVYAFYGLVGFAALPFFLWFWLTQRDAASREQ